MPRDPAVWILQNPGKNLGPALGEFASAFPGKPLLIVASGTIFHPRDAKSLAAMASRQAGAVVLTSLIAWRNPPVARMATVFALAVTLGDLGARFWRHRRDFAGSLRTPSAPAGRPSLT
ncbi:hypothetical protein D3C83_35750 [compost metagenome]